MEMICPKCGKAFWVPEKKTRGRPRKYCPDCRPGKVKAEAPVLVPE